MQEVNIYIDTSIHGPAKRKGYYIYVLECVREGGAITVDGKGALAEGTENSLALMSLLTALKRLNQPCSVRVFTRCQHVLNAMQNHWARQWQKNEWMNAKGQAVKNSELWCRVLDELDKHLYQFGSNAHEYETWMRRELGKTEQEET